MDYEYLNESEQFFDEKTNMPTGRLITKFGCII